MPSDSFFDKISKAKDKLEDAVESLKDRVEGVVQRLQGKEITFYPTYGYREHADPATWVIPVRVWVHDNRDTPLVEDYIERKVIRRFEDDLDRALTDDEKRRLEVILADFIADDKTREEVEFTFEDDTDGEVFRLTKRTTPNGIIVEDVKLSDTKARKMLEGRAPGDVWLKIRARTTDGDGAGEGRVRLLEPQGLSVVSDIDDTIKVTQIPAGKKTVMRNTFLKEFKTAEGMLERYLNFGAEYGFSDVSFHYVSGGPWQMYRPLSRFLIERSGFPAGTFHMKELGLNLLAPGSFDSVRKYILGGDLVTLDQKIRQITNLMLNLPGRKFILVGDSGEKDPEVFRAMKDLFPDRVLKIYIRDVLYHRLEGMERITGPDVSVMLDTSAIMSEMRELVKSKAIAPQDDERDAL